jgi:anti-sigma factor RsiW
MTADDSYGTPLDERTQRELAALADGSLQGARREALEARIGDDPALRAALERQRSGLAAMRGLDLPAPDRLRQRIEAERTRPSAPVRRRRLGFAGGLAGAVAAIALALVLALPSGSGGPTVVEAAQLSSLPATVPPAAVDPANPKVLRAEIEGVPFPNLHAEFTWQQTGRRTDELDGRDTQTVFYERNGQRIGYTILSGDSIDPPAGAQPSTQNGVRLHTSSEGGEAIVTWLRDGRTCVLSGKGVSAKDLREVASWKGDGAVPF